MHAGGSGAGGHLMGGLSVQKLVATGASQSGARLITYINAVHPLTELFDAFVPTITSGRGTPLDAPALHPDRPAPAPVPAARLGTQTQIREDLRTPVLILNSECEAVGMFPSRRPDDDRFRFWEVAGAPHVVAVVPAEHQDGRVDNPLSYRPVLSAAYGHVQAWITNGTVPPAQPRIEFTGATPPSIKRDPNGNAVGGIRLPEMEAPVAEYHGRDEDAEGLGALYGWARPFSPEKLRSLYPSAEAYISLWRSAVDRLADTGAIRPEDAGPMRSRGTEMAAALGI